MLIDERQQKIVSLVNEQKSIRVTELSKFFSVTEETIRRDLEKLEKNNKLLRSHGGAIAMDSTSPLELTFSEREVMNVKEKKEIAFQAVKEVEEGDTIILDASSTAWYMAKSLPDMAITVVTNSIKVSMELSTKKQITVISTGGTLYGKALSYVGPLAEKSLDMFHVNKAFISCKAFHLEFGISESTELEARMKTKMIEGADTVYVMIDHSKIGKRAFAHIHSIDCIDHIITNEYPKTNQFKQLENSSLHLIKV